MKVRVKICGNKRLKDALQAIALGADAVGLLVGQVHTSRDFIAPELAQSIVQKLPVFCSSVLVTQIIDVHEIIDLVKFVGANTLQLHGESASDDVAQIKQALPYIKIIKSIHVIDETSIKDGKKYIGIVDGILLDSINKATGQVGGTGKTHDWTISKKIVKEYKIPVILAGGLTPENVEEAINFVRPFAVDVNSGVKNEKGYKDYKKLESFIKNAKGVGL